MPDDPRDVGHPFGRRSGGNGSNGARPKGMAARPVPLNEFAAEPLDLVAVQADDEFINALSAGMSVSAPGIGGYDADLQVAAMLAAWKADVDADPLPEIDLDLATAAVMSSSRRAPSGRLRHLVPLASAAALIVVAITGVSIGAQDARPGDALFAVSKVLYQEQAKSYEALDTVQKSQAKAKQALAVGDKETAAAAVAEGKVAATQVLAEHGYGEVVQEMKKLEVKVDETTPGVPNPVEEPPPAAAQAPAGTTTTEPGTPGTTEQPGTTSSPSSTAQPDTTSADPGSGTPGTPEQPDGSTENPPGGTAENPPAPTEPPPGGSTENPPGGSAENPPGGPAGSPGQGPSGPAEPTEKPAPPTEAPTKSGGAGPAPTSAAPPPTSSAPAAGTTSAPASGGTASDSSKDQRRCGSPQAAPSCDLDGSSSSATGTATATPN